MNNILITPGLYKSQLVSRITTMIDRQRGKRFKPQDGITDILDGKATELFIDKARDLRVNLVIDGDKYTEKVSELYIEDIWSLYLGCEPIYQFKLADYEHNEG